jgi:hypothetical protein
MGFNARPHRDLPIFVAQARHSRFTGFTQFSNAVLSPVISAQEVIT